MTSTLLGEHASQFFVEPETGVRLSCFEAGSYTSLPVLILLPGLSGSAMHLLDSFKSLASHTKLIAIDWRGHGESKAGHGFRLARLGADVLCVVRKRLGSHRFCLLGHSMGAGVIWSILDNHMHEISSQLAGVAVIDQAPTVAESPTKPADYHHAVYPIAFAAEATARVASGVPDMVAEFRQQFAKGFAASEEQVENWLAFTAGCDPVGVAKLLWDSLTSDWTDLCRRMDTTVLVVGGDASMVPAGALQWVAHACPRGAHLRILPGGTHCPFLQPELSPVVCSLLLSLLDGSLEPNVLPSTSNDNVSPSADTKRLHSEK